MKTTLPEPWLTIRKYYGTVEKMAKTLGVTRQTFRQWIRGTRNPCSSAQKLLNLFLQAHGYPAQEWPPTKYRTPMQVRAEAEKNASRNDPNMGGSNQV